MSWQPTEEEIEMMRTISGMTIDCIMGKGTDNKETFLSNLRIMADMIEKMGKKG